MGLKLHVPLLAFADFQCRAVENLERLRQCGRRQFRQRLVRQHQHGIAGQDGRVGVPFGVDRGLAPAERSRVHKIDYYEIPLIHPLAPGGHHPRRAARHRGRHLQGAAAPREAAAARTDGNGARRMKIIGFGKDERERDPLLSILPLRGNVNTRLQKLDNGDYDAVILAAAGLIRLEFGDRIRHCLPSELSMPACGQGAVGIECRTDDAETIALLQPLLDPDTWITVSAERAMNKRLNGGCQVPIAGYATLTNDTMTLNALVGSIDGQQMIHQQAQSQDLLAVEALGEQVATGLLNQGAAAILAAVYG